MVAWERQPGETNTRFHAFIHYRDMGYSRSVKKAFVLHLKECTTTTDPDTRHQDNWQRWCAEHDWVSRSGAYDTHLDKLKIKALEKDIMSINQRHMYMARVLENRLLDKLVGMNVDEISGRDLAPLLKAMLDMDYRSNDLPTSRVQLDLASADGFEERLKKYSAIVAKLDASLDDTEIDSTDSTDSTDSGEES